MLALIWKDFKKGGRNRIIKDGDPQMKTCRIANDEKFSVLVITTSSLCDSDLFLNDPPEVGASPENALR